MPLSESQALNKIYTQQNQKIKKKLSHVSESQISTSFHAKKSLQMLVVGPSQSGKRSLIRTMSYAVNGCHRQVFEKKSNSEISYDKYIIKRPKRQKIQGLSVLKEIDQKVSVNAYLINSNKRQENYEWTLIKRFMQQIALQKEPIINFVVICLDSSKRTDDETCKKLKDLIQKLNEKGINYMLAGCYVDIILGNDVSKQEQQMVMMQNWRDYASTCLKIYKSDVYFIENYQNIQAKASQQINFYALGFLDKCLCKLSEVKQNKKPIFRFLCFEI